MRNTDITATDVTIIEWAENTKGLFYSIYLKPFPYIKIYVPLAPSRFILLVLQSGFLMPTMIQHLAGP